MPRHQWVRDLTPQYQTLLLCVTLSLGYCTTYLFTRPLFVLPDHYLNVTSSPGSEIDRQTAMALAQSLGYLSSKFPAISLMSSATFFRHRQLCLSSLFVFTASTVGVGFALFDSSPIWQSVSVGVSSVSAGMIYGGMLSYAEGRGSTELIVASLNLMLVLAGGIARFLGSSFLNMGVAPQWVPFTASCVGLVIGLVLLDLLAALPPPSAKDIQDRGVRRSMTGAERMQFIKRYLPGLFLSVVAYSTIMTIRSFRDYFAVQLYTEANGGTPVSASMYFWADFPGAMTVCFSLGALSYIKSNRKTLMFMICAMIFGVTILGGGTLLYTNHVWGGIAWQVSCGVGIYSAYLVMGSAFFDRLLAASNSEGTIVFLQFISDGTGWFGTVGILFWKSLVADKNMPGKFLWCLACGGVGLRMFELVCRLNACFVFFLLLLLKSETIVQCLNCTPIFVNGRR